jgi:hypothetical protein
MSLTRITGQDTELEESFCAAERRIKKVNAKEKKQTFKRQISKL